MKRKAYGRDAGLTLRMLFTSGLLGLLYVAFALVLFYVLNAGVGLMIVIVVGMAFVQYFTSDKLALIASGAVTTGLWRRLEPREVEGVIAHELTHIGNRDVLIMTLASFFAMLAGIL